MIGGNKPADSVPPPMEPVAVPEARQRALILESSLPAYPATAKGQQGSVVLQVLIARDGSVQDAKFLQGSLLFARNAIDAVRQWKFKPYSINGHPVSVLTQITIRFKPEQ
jgi:protein TonB